MSLALTATSAAPQRPRPTTSAIRLGVFYDGGWFTHLWQYLADHSIWRASPAFAGIHDLLRWYLHQQLDRPLTQITLSQAHYVLGRPETAGSPDDAHSPTPRGASRRWDHMLKEEGIVRHDVLCAGNREIGADVELALVVHELALARCFDIAALITGDADFLPLINRLRASGIGVLIPSFTQADGALHAVRTSPALIQAADHAPSWEHLLTCGLDPDYRLRYPFTAPVKGATSQRAADGYRYGTVNKWQDGAAFGFITDTDGVNWFVSKQALPPDLKSLSVGRQVRFNGRPRPTPGKPYPEARAVQPHEPEEPGTESRDR